MNSTLTLSSPQRSLTSPARQESLQPSVSSLEILRGQKAVEISHNGNIYKLQATRLGKLILTK